MFLESSVIPKDDVKSDTSSGSVESFLPPKKRMRPLNDDASDHNYALVPIATKKVAISSGNANYKGLVQHKNGNWGAQIYADHKRIWIGTFKSAAEAARAYDSASIKVHSFDVNPHRNFPLSDLTIHEPEFQQGYTREAVLNMIRDGSYQQKFVDFLRIRSQINTVGTKQRQEDEESNKSCFSCTHLFRKELTISDVGKLNRLVIPKRYALKYLPCVSDDQSEREEGEIVEDVEVLFYDRGMREWKFRYCYWKSSQSFVFTTGWNGFVKEKKLKEKDAIDFYTCDVKTLELGQSKNFLMIDVHCFSDDDSSVVTNEDVNEIVHIGSEEEMKTINFLSSKLEDEETKLEEKKGGFMLFGVKICQ